MNHRHLLPDEIDLLLDDEEGFGVAPLRAHLDGCATCRAEYDRLALVVGHLEALPLLAPRPLFTDRVMSQVQVFEPWHVALRNSVRRFVPQSTTGRVLVGATGGAAAVGLSALTIWVGQRADALVFVGGLGAQRLRESVVGLVSSGASALLGESVAAAIRDGGMVAVTGSVAAGTVALVAVAFGVKTLATAGRRGS